MGRTALVDRRIRRGVRVGVVLLLVVAAAACTGDGADPSTSRAATTEPSIAGPTTAGATVAPATIPPLGTPPTDAAIAAHRLFEVPPADFLDCGSQVLTSGWPTTTAYFNESADQCLLDAAGAGTLAQHVVWGRDDRGGLDGTILRVLGLDEIVQIEYHVTADGVLTSGEGPCPTLIVDFISPPGCAIE